jgi:uncharacterized protein (DUF885 family)
MRRLLPCLVLAAACASGSPALTSPLPAPIDVTARAAEDTSDDAAIARAAREYLELETSIYPEHATQLGIHTADTELDDRSLEAEARGLAREETMARDLKARFATIKASRAARTDLAVLQHLLTADVRSKRELRPLERQPDVYTDPMNAIFLMLARDYAPAQERAKNALARMEKIGQVVAAAKANLKTPPRIWTQVGIERAKSAKAFFEEQRPLLSAALPGEGPRVDAAVSRAALAYADYATFLEKVVLPRSTGEFAAGKPLFEFLVHEGYFLKDDVDSIYALGEKIFARTDAQMTEVAHRIDPKAKGWPEVTARLKGNHPPADGLLAGYRTEVLRARAFLVAHDVVPFPPDDVLDVIDTPQFQRTTITAAYDEPPPFDPVTKGFFFVTPVDRTLPAHQQEEMLRENDWGDIVDTTVHEAYPGHHLQLSFARRNPSLIRRASSPAILEEGWALYSEELMAELGYYTDEQRLMQLEWTLVRAARILIDIGLHTRGMTFEQGVALLTDRVHLENELAVSEVKRYTMTPTQPLSYLVGREMLFRLRDRFKEREKERFTLKRFHAEVLSRGGIAPGLLEEEMFEP